MHYGQWIPDDNDGGGAPSTAANRKVLLVPTSILHFGYERKINSLLK